MNKHFLHDAAARLLGRSLRHILQPDPDDHHHGDNSDRRCC